MQIKKITKKIETNVSSQSCVADCMHCVNATPAIYKEKGSASGCMIYYDARWSLFW